MNNRPWTPEELRQLVGVRTIRGDVEPAARKIGRTYESTRIKLQKLGATVTAGLTAESIEKLIPAVADKPEDPEERTWKARYRDLSTKHNKLQESSLEEELLLQEFVAAAPKSYKTAPKVARRHPQGTGAPQSALLLFSDTHVGKVVSPDQTLGFGGYNFDTFLNRLKYVEESVGSILADHTNTEVPELVVAMLGDMIDGALNHGEEASQRDTLFDQFYSAGHAIAQFYRNLAAQVPKVRIFTACGNHSRWQNQRRTPNTNRFSNLDMFLYTYVQALTSDIETIEWNLNRQPVCLFDVQGFKFHGSHGDHWRGGDKALGIPNHAIGRQLSATSQLFSKIGEGAPNYYVTGHLHRSITIPHALGHVLVNGGFPGLDAYALMGNFNPVDPTQRLALVHPRFGLTAQYELSLKHAVADEEPAYEIPGPFAGGCE